MNTIVWKDAPYNTKYGLVGGLQLFAVTWKSRREDPSWLMRCELPGLLGQEWKDDDIEALKTKAAEVLEDWLRRVFGVLPGRAECADPAFDAYAERCQIGHDMRPLSHEAFDAGWLARGSQVMS